MKPIIATSSCPARCKPKSTLNLTGAPQNNNYNDPYADWSVFVANSEKYELRIRSLLRDFNFSVLVVQFFSTYYFVFL